MDSLRFSRNLNIGLFLLDVTLLELTGQTIWVLVAFAHIVLVAIAMWGLRGKDQ